ncbi:MAG TPA: outer membrane lipoprotein carrier protein LolA [Hellea balneolensis]|uniref:Outer membrane lipoprotein carrier protein LolA n=1 Tax=Hellea balneolensis TaxID=287478 RepID=A0A7C5M049_9PROT|nr:outer membrane lipoprotein carrier protein LolA [Hellea balneolensis]
MKNNWIKTIVMASLSMGAVAATAQVQPQSRQSAPVAQRLPAFTHPQTVSQDLARIDAALNNTVSFSGRFAQYGSDGSFSQGRIYLKRPGKIRFEYDPPEALLMVSDGVTLTQIDKRLETKDRVPLKSTPLAFFLANNIKLEDDVEVISLQKTPMALSLTARDGSGQMDGTITMVFDPQNLALKEWIIHDGFGQQTRVILSELRYNEKLNPRLFVLRDDRRRDRRR